jgi:hypothetical protein
VEKLSKICGKEIGGDFKSIASLWLCSKKFKSLNICTTVVFMGLVENEKLPMLSGESMVWNVSCLLHVCKDVEKMVHHAKRRCDDESAGGGCKGMGEKRIKFTVAALPPNLSQDARTAWPDEEYFITDVLFLMMVVGRWMNILMLALLCNVCKSWFSWDWT